MLSWSKENEKGINKKVYKIKCNIEALKEAIEIAGGMQQLANKIDVSYQSILNWKSGRSTLSPLNCVRIEEALNGQVTRKDILPDYPWEQFK